MAKLVYILCALASLFCTALLLRGFVRSGTRLLLWTALCFLGFSINNVLVFIDLVVLPAVDLSLIRTLPSLGGLIILAYGLVWDTAS